MSGCASCGGGCCASCGGCGKSLELTMAEVELLQKLAQIPFLPVARRADDENPVFLEDRDRTVEEYGLILRCLEKKGLISLDYDKPLKGFGGAAYATYPLRGSMALTARGQTVVDLLEKQGMQA